MWKLANLESSLHNNNFTLRSVQVSSECCYRGMVPPSIRTRLDQPAGELLRSANLIIGQFRPRTNLWISYSVENLWFQNAFYYFYAVLVKHCDWDWDWGGGLKLTHLETKQ